MLLEATAVTPADGESDGDGGAPPPPKPVARRKHSRPAPAHEAPYPRVHVAKEAVRSEYDGIKLYLSETSITGYKGVSLRADKPRERPYNAAHAGLRLGSYATALEAALAYARSVRGQTTAKPLYPPRKRGGGPTGGDMPVAKPRKPKGDGTGMLPRPKKPKPAREEEAFVAAARRGAERAAEEDGEEGDDANLAANRPKRRNYLTTLESIRSTMSHHGMMASEKEQLEWAMRGYEEQHRQQQQQYQAYKQQRGGGGLFGRRPVEPRRAVARALRRRAVVPLDGRRRAVALRRCRRRDSER